MIEVNIIVKNILVGEYRTGYQPVQESQDKFITKFFVRFEVFKHLFGINSSGILVGHFKFFDHRLHIRRLLRRLTGG